MTSSLDRVNEIFSDPVFDKLDKAALVKTFDTSPQLEALYQGYFAQAGRRIQVGNVIERIPSAGIVIQLPGTYTFGGNISWSPNRAQCSAITILSSDVTLDLAGFTLTASAPDKSQQISGIVVGSASDPAITNIATKNGTVANVPEHGWLSHHFGPHRHRGVHAKPVHPALNPGWNQSQRIEQCYDFQLQR